MSASACLPTTELPPLAHRRGGDKVDDEDGGEKYEDVNNVLHR